MVDSFGATDSFQIWLALATSGLVLLGFSSVAASLAASSGALYRRHIFGIRSITTNSLYLSAMSFLPLLLLQFQSQGDALCAATGFEHFGDCKGWAAHAGSEVWALTSLGMLIGLAWQFFVQMWRIALLRDWHDSIRIAVFFVAPLPLIAYLQWVNFSANLMALSLIGAAFFAWTACGHFYLFLHRLNADN